MQSEIYVDLRVHTGGFVSDHLWKWAIEMSSRTDISQAPTIVDARTKNKYRWGDRRISPAYDPGRPPPRKGVSFVAARSRADLKMTYPYLN